MKKTKKPWLHTTQYRLQHELDLLKEEMARAMQDAYTPYVAEGRPTLHMREILERFYDWARRYEEACK